MSADCKCEIVESKYGPEIAHCSLHSAAPDLLEAAEVTQEWTDALLEGIHSTSKEQMAVDADRIAALGFKAKRLTRIAITKAEGAS